MIEPLNQLAFAMHALPGGYALLLGSGVSTGAGIPTGWAIVENLARTLAQLEGVQAPDVFAWFREQYGVDADYSFLLERLGGTQAERQRILRGYFEPTDEERARGKKIPGRAHKAIAELVAAGAVRVIVTTNFDQLLETAIREQGVVPQIVSGADSAKGCVPLALAGCTIIKANGDYVDTRIRNTAGELESYEAPLAKLLTQVFDEYGLVVCGWSADWDIGLRALISAAPRRFSTFWWQRGPLSATAQTFVEFRRVVLTPISDADEAFEQLATKTHALRAFDRAHPMSVALLVQELKQHLVDDTRRIRLADMVRREKDAVVTAIEKDPFDPSQRLSDEIARGAVARYEAMCESLVALLATGCYWATQEQEQLFVDVVRVIARRTSRPPQSFYDDSLGLRVYPALLCLYAAGIGAVARQNYRLLRALLDIVVDCVGSGRDKFIVTNPFAARDYAKRIEGRHNRVLALSEHLADRLRAPFTDVLPDAGEYDLYFNRFEYFTAVQAVSESGPEGWAPMGRFGFEFLWRHDGRSRDFAMSEVAEEQGANWPPLAAGLFGGTVENFQSSVAQVIKLAAYLRR